MDRNPAFLREQRTTFTAWSTALVYVRCHHWCGIIYDSIYSIIITYGIIYGFIVTWGDAKRDEGRVLHLGSMQLNRM
jgi:hypothetical protein